jgi:thiamine transport system substrate-binding protein
LAHYKPHNADKLFPELRTGNDWYTVPYDYSYYAICYDSQALQKAGLPVPQSLEDLTKPVYKSSLILEDPRTSSVGLGFFTWVKAVYGGRWKAYWKRLQPSILTVSAGWDAAYGLFTNGEAPLVLSYTTDEAYNVHENNNTRYRAAIFKAGQPMQVETASLLAGAKNVEAAKKFLDFVLSPSFQETIPLGNWMYPVIDIPLPACFKDAPKASKTLQTNTATDASLDIELDSWAALF